MSQVSGIAMAWIFMAGLSLSVGAWSGLELWSGEETLKSDLQAYEALEDHITAEPLPVTFNPLDIEAVRAELELELIAIAPEIVLGPIVCERTEPLGESSLVACRLAVEIQNITLEQLQKLLSGEFPAAEVAEVRLQIPNPPNVQSPETWNVTLTLTRIHEQG